MKTKVERFVLKNVLARLPDTLLIRLAGGKPVTIAGRTLHPLLQAMMFLNRNAPLETLPLPQARSFYSRVLAVVQAEPLPMARIEDMMIEVAGGSIRLRCHTPPGAGKISPAIVYFHGGGHVIGNIDDYDCTVRYIATQTGCRLINVDYRCAPEHQFPTAAEDAIAAWVKVHDSAQRLGIDATRIALMGDSAGGNLAAVVALAARDRKLAAPKLQCLIYPMTDLHLDTASMTLFGDGFGLTKSLMQWFVRHYVRTDADHNNPLASPLLAARHANLAPVIVTVAGFDPLHDEGVAYAEKLSAAGVPTTLLRHDDLIHGWVTMTGAVPPARAALDETCRAVRTVLFA